MNYLKDKVSRIPLPVVPATLGFLVLSGTYDTLGFPLVHVLAVAVATLVAAAYCLKVAFHLKSVVAAEYANPMLAALYPTLPMLVMVLCAYYASLFPAAETAAKTVFFSLMALLVAHVVVFFARFFLRRFEWKTFMPSWYVTTNGVMVSTVAGMAFMPKPLAVGVVVWGIAIYVLVTPFMLWRMKRCEVAEATMHSQAIMLGPCSMCLVSSERVVGAAPACRGAVVRLHRRLACVRGREAADLLFGRLPPWLCRHDVPHGRRSACHQRCCFGVPSGRPA